MADILLDAEMKMGEILEAIPDKKATTGVMIVVNKKLDKNFFTCGIIQHLQKKADRNTFW